MRIDSSGNVIVKQGQLEIQSAGNVPETNVIKIGTHPSGTFGSQISASTFYNSYLTTDLRFSTTNPSGIVTERMSINSGGDISFRDTSANEAFYWDASAASLGIGTGSSPNARLNVKSTGSTTDQITLTHSGNTVNLVAIGQESGHGSLPGPYGGKG